MISDFLFKQKTKDIQLCISKDEKNNLFLNVEDTVTGKRMLLKKFNGQYHYQKFLVEAVLLRLISNKKLSKKAIDCYYNLIKFLKDESSEKTFN